MKKAISLILALVLCFSLCACGNNSENISASATTQETAAPVVEPAATLKTKDGQTVEMTASELVAIYKENEAKYNSTYKEAETTISGTVESIKEENVNFGGSTQKVYRLALAEGWEITVLAKDHEEVIDLSKGDKVEVSSKLQSVSIFGVVGMMNVGSVGMDFHDNTIITITQ